MLRRPSATADQWSVVRLVAVSLLLSLGGDLVPQVDPEGTCASSCRRAASRPRWRWRGGRRGHMSRTCKGAASPTASCSLRWTQRWSCPRSLIQAPPAAHLRTGEVEDAFKMTHLRMVYSAATQAQRTKSKAQENRHQLTMAAATVQGFIVGGRHNGSRSVGNPYFTHTFEALTDPLFIIHPPLALCCSAGLQQD